MTTLTPRMQAALGHFQETGNFEGFRATTVQGLERRGLVQRTAAGYVAVGETAEAQPPRALKQLRTFWFDPALDANVQIDWGTIDYQWWDRARSCQVRGLEKAGALLNPLASKTAAWTMGLQPKIKCKRAKSQDLLTKWLARVYSDVLRAFEDAVALADCYLVINPPDAKGHLALTVVHPSCVRPMVDENDFSRIIGWQITERHPHPTRVGEYMVIADSFYADKRVRKVTKNGVELRTDTYKNLIGRVPVVKLSFAQRANERFGRPIGLALLYILFAYEQVLNDAIVGNRKQGRPTPVIEEMGTQKQIQEFWTAFGRQEKYTAADGTQQEHYVLDLSSDDVLTLGNNAKFKYAQPGSFTADTMNLLQLLYYLMIEHAEFPEFIMGNAIASSKASTETQLPPFVKFIQKIQGQCEVWLLELLSIAQAYLSLWEPGVAAADELEVKWPKLTTDDGKLTLEAARFALDNALLTDEEVLALIPLDVDDPGGAVKRARAQLEERRAEEEARQQEQNPDVDLPDISDEPTPPVETRRAPGDVVSEAQASRKGAITAFFLDAGSAQVLSDAAVDAGLDEPTPVADLHLTLTFLGQAPDLDVTEEQVMQCLGDFVLAEFGFIGTISGVGRFQAVAGNRDALVALVDAPDLPEFRQALVEALEAAGVTVNRTHGFVPHITLGYLASEDPTPAIDIPAIKLVFDQLTLAWGDNRTVFDLKGARVGV